ncbi:MAG: hypothetical protein ACI81V_000429 [Lentimonas sp.]|jgi:hypothetical protein
MFFKNYKIPLLLGLTAILVVAFLSKNFYDRDYSGLEPFPTAEYIEKPADFLGNTYRLKAQIEAQVKWDKRIGRILSIRTDRTAARLPVFVPNLASNNLHTGQRYDMRVRIEDGGLIYVENLRKY